ncbi:hypothetical protein [Anaplasma phagocytophilum]|uniref:Uncharacterized protein n=1 Tax=Anaplasma phagocytophilum TaxID=948 RepID=A0A098EE12_ANAPH|nr:hypothetical protein [Anaplasma phagocytophilum]CEG20539.1 Uncharacterized protein ANAPHAGO_00857 [Anaplasma phagocytophilum]
MAKLFFSLRSDDSNRGDRTALPEILSLHPTLQRNLLSETHLSEDGLLRLCSDFTFRVSNAFFVEPGNWGDFVAESPYVVVDANVDPLLANLCARYSDVVRFYDMSIWDGNVRGKIRLSCNDAGSLKRVMCFIKDVLSCGGLGFGRISSRAPAFGRARSLSHAIANACDGFVRSYLLFYMHRIISAGCLEQGMHGEKLRVSADFFMRFMDGSALLHDESAAGFLSALYSCIAIIPCMREKGFRASFSAIFHAIRRLDNTVKQDVLKDDVAAVRAFSNARVASLVGGCDSDASAEELLERVFHDMGCVENGLATVAAEAKEILAIIRCFSGTPLPGDLMDLLEGDEDFRRYCQKYSKIAKKLRSPFRVMSKDAPINRVVAPGGYPLLCDIENKTDAFLRRERRLGPVFMALLEKYERFHLISDMGGAESLRGVRATLMKWRSPVTAMRRFARFCLRDFLMIYGSAALVQGGSMNVDLGSGMEINSRVHSVRVLGYGARLLPAARCLDSDTDVGDDLSDAGDREGDELGLAGYSPARQRMLKYVLVAVFFISILMLCAATVLLIMCGMEDAMMATVGVVMLTVAALLIPYVLHLLCSIWEAELQQKAELYLCLKIKDNDLFEIAGNALGEDAISFRDNQLYINNSVVPAEKYEVTLVESRDRVPQGNCILLGLKASQEDMQMFKAISSTMNALPIHGLSIAEGASGCGMSGSLLRYDVKLNTRSSFLHAAEILGRAGHAELLLAYVDSYVAAALLGDGSSAGLSKKFLYSRKFMLLSQDQDRWGILDIIEQTCSKFLVGDRRRFLDCVREALKEDKRLFIDPLVSMMGPGFPFDRSGYQDIAMFVSGWDPDGNCFSVEGVVHFTGISFVRDGNGVEFVDDASQFIQEAVECNVSDVRVGGAAADGRFRGAM